MLCLMPCMLQIEDRGDGLYKCSYTASRAGTYQLQAYSGRALPHIAPHCT